MSGSERSAKGDEGTGAEGKNAGIIEALGALREYLASKPEVRDALRVLAKHVLGEDAPEAPEQSHPVEVEKEMEKEKEKVALTLSIGGVTRDVAGPAPGPPSRRARVAWARGVLREAGDARRLAGGGERERVVRGAAG